MTNPVKGEASFRIGDTTYTLAYGFAALCEVEDVAGAPLPELLAELAAKKPRMRTIGAFILGGLRKHHPQIDLDTAGELLMANQPVVVGAMAKALEASLPKAPSAGGKAPPKPTTNRRRGTG